MVAGSALAAASRGASAPGPVHEPTEHEVKAAFLYHFAELVSWPSVEHRAGAPRPMVIAVVGRDPFGDQLESTIAGQSVRGRPIRILRAASVHALGVQPQILFVGARSAAEARTSLDAVRGVPVLTVGACDDFAESGGMIRFRLTPDRRVAFDINLGAVQGAGLKMSSQLLKIARIVEARR
jgi:hypothetical protein